MPPRYVLIRRFAELTGYTVKAVQRKMEDGVWVEGREWKKAPDGHPMIDVEGFQRWVEGGRGPELKSAANASTFESASHGKEKGAEKHPLLKQRRPVLLSFQ